MFHLKYLYFGLLIRISITDFSRSLFFCLKTVFRWRTKWTFPGVVGYDRSEIRHTHPFADIPRKCWHVLACTAWPLGQQLLVCFALHGPLARIARFTSAH